MSGIQVGDGSDKTEIELFDQRVLQRLSELADPDDLAMYAVFCDCDDPSQCNCIVTE